MTSEIQLPPGNFDSHQRQVPRRSPRRSPGFPSCKHYKTKLCSAFYFDCCQKVAHCHRCHMENDQCTVKPPQISRIQCSVCHHQQSPGPTCEQCNTAFSKSYCDTCKIWTDLEIFHCDKCGLCRVGKASEMFHCDQCDACFHLEGKPNHQCARTTMRDALCSICMDSVHNAQKTSTILPCLHVVHSECWKAAAAHGEFRCPCCRKSVIDMTAVWDAIRSDIARNSLPLGVEFRAGDVLSSPLGPFLVERRRVVVTGDPNDIHGGQFLFEGHFPEWKLANGKYSKGTIAAASLSLNVCVQCNDCSSVGPTPYHDGGLECKSCGSFNTVKK